MACAARPSDVSLPSNMACCFGKKTHTNAEVAPMKSHPTRMPTSVSANGFRHPRSENFEEKQIVQTSAGVQNMKPKSTLAAEEGSEKSENSATTPPDGTLFQLPTVIIERVPDGEGNPITLGKLFGVWTAPWPSLPQQIVRSQHFSFHDTDVVLLGYAKSGSHWMWEMLHMLLKGRAEHSRTPKERLMLSFSTQEFFDTLAPPRVFNCHAPFYGLPPVLKSGKNKCRMVYIVRNPKDLAVSYYHHLKSATEFHYDGTFHGFLDLFLQGNVPGDSWFDYVLGWEQTLRNNPQLPVLTLHYEDVKENPALAVRKVAEFIGVPSPQQLLEDITRECSIERMRQVDQQLKDQFPANISKTGHNYIYRKGEVGDWKRWFSVLDNEKFDKVLASKLKDSQLKFRYELPERAEVETTRL